MQGRAVWSEEGQSGESLHTAASLRKHLGRRKGIIYISALLTRSHKMTLPVIFLCSFCEEHLESKKDMKIAIVIITSLLSVSWYPAVPQGQF